MTQTKLRVALSAPVFCLEDTASAPCNSGATVITADAERWEIWRQTVRAKCREMGEWLSNYDYFHTFFRYYYDYNHFYF